MTFEEWYDTVAKYVHPGDIRQWMSEAWDAAVLAEREACAKVCEAEALNVKWSDYIEGCDECAAAIRARGEK